MYDLAHRPPKLGSPLETLFVLVLRMREERKHLLDTAQILGVLGEKKAAATAFDEYSRVLSFDTEPEPQQQAPDRMQVILDAWMQAGPMNVETQRLVRSRKGR